MTSVFDVIEDEDRNDQTKRRQAAGLAHQRVEDRFGSFVRQGSVDDQAARWDLVHEDLVQTVASACAQVGYGTPEQIEGVLASIKNNFVTAEAQPQLRTAGVRHEARKPKMCPYHSEVTDISLAAGDPSAGFNAMAQHAWSKSHCQGGEYEGDRCKFKPEMTTQSYWDSRAEKLEQKRQERAEREEQEALQAEQPVQEIPQSETPAEDIPETSDVPEAAEQTDYVEHSEPSAIGEGVEEIPMAMAASTKTADGGPIPKMDKRRWTPKTVPHDQPLKADDPDGRHPTKRKDVVDPITQKPDTPDNKSKLTEIGEQVTERQDVDKKWDGPNYGEQGGTHTEDVQPLTAVSSDASTTTLLAKHQINAALDKFKRD